MVGLNIIVKCPVCGEIEKSNFGITRYYKVEENGESYLKNECTKCKARYLTNGVDSGYCYGDTFDEIKDSVLKKYFYMQSTIENMSVQEFIEFCKVRDMRILSKKEFEEKISESIILTKEMESKLIASSVICW